MAVCKSDKNELAVEKCTELGVSQFIFFEAKHSIAQLSDNKIKRLNRAAESAAEQSKQNQIPKISYINQNLYQELNKQLENHNSASRLICSLESKPQNISELQLESSVIIAVGPEGDFSKDEYRFFQSQNFQAISLGNSTLRSETAAIACCARILL